MSALSKGTAQRNESDSLFLQQLCCLIPDVRYYGIGDEQPVLSLPLKRLLEELDLSQEYGDLVDAPYDGCDLPEDEGVLVEQVNLHILGVSEHRVLVVNEMSFLDTNLGIPLLDKEGL